MAYLRGRTSNLLIRSQMLYPIELQVRLIRPVLYIMHPRLATFFLADFFSGFRARNRQTFARNRNHRPPLPPPDHFLLLRRQRQLPRIAAFIRRQFKILRLRIRVEYNKQMVIIALRARMLAATVNPAGNRLPVRPVRLRRAIRPVPPDVGKLARNIFPFENAVRNSAGCARRKAINSRTN